jgi:hypothetical protein
VKKITLTAIAFTIIFGVQLLTADKSEAGYNDPWYACYVVSGGSLQKCIGPFQNKYACQAKKYTIPYGATWMGCRQ